MKNINVNIKTIKESNLFLGLPNGEGNQQWSSLSSSQIRSDLSLL